MAQKHQVTKSISVITGMVKQTIVPACPVLRELLNAPRGPVVYVRSLYVFLYVVTEPHKAGFGQLIIYVMCSHVIASYLKTSL